jgi:hypothetical protein
VRINVIAGMGIRFVVPVPVPSALTFGRHCVKVNPLIHRMMGF